MNKLESLSIFVGTGRCNADCAHCAGKIHREYAPKEDGIIDEELIRKTMKDCYVKGARYLSISSSGEPTLSPKSVTRLLEIVHDNKNSGINYNPINLYSNGIKIGNDEYFCKEYLPLWKEHGLTTIYVTVHDIDERRNAEIYRIKSYPPIETIVARIKDEGLSIRANMVLCKNTTYTLDKFISTVEHLRGIGVDKISAWPIRSIDDNIDNELSPQKEELDKMSVWIKENDHINIRLLREDNQALYLENKKLTLFPDGTLTNKWCR